MFHLESFLDRVLRPDLHKVLERRDAARDNVARCHQLRMLLDEIALAADTVDERDVRVAAKTAGPTGAPLPPPPPAPVTILTDIGCHNYMECELADPSTVHVNIGAGVIAPLSEKEARVFLAKKEVVLRKNIERMSREALRVKYRIRLVMEAITRVHDAAIAAGSACR